MELDKHYKVRVNPEQSRKIQELLFALGGCWLSGSHFKEPVMLDADCLFLNKLMVLTCTRERGNCYFENKHTHTEIQADELIALLTDLSKSAENPLQKTELTPEFEASEPKFKVGDKVYLFGTDYIEEITKIIGANVYLAGADFDASVSVKEICHATPENYERLQATFPHIEFEQPPKELKGSDLCFKKLRNGKKLVMCAVSDLSDERAIKRLQDGDNYIRIIKDCDSAKYHFIDVHGIIHGFAVPLNDETGEPLTESVIDE